jgi:hypothetical protein
MTIMECLIILVNGWTAILLLWCGVLAVWGVALWLSERLQACWEWVSLYHFPW